jgi:pimeloyl-ACP methyl ester carboxylesterase
MPTFTGPDGVRLCYEIVGEGPPLLLHLGSGCDSTLWQRAGYLEPLSKSYRCIVFDHRGHGRSDKPRGPEANHLDRYVADVVALQDHAGIGRSAFWGYSAGISVGLKLALDHPTRVSAMVGSGGMGQATPEQIRELVASRVAELRQYGWEKLLDRFDKQEPEPVPEWMKEQIRATDTQQFIDWFLALPDWDWDDWASLPQIATPTLFMVGELEDPKDETARAAGLMPNATRVRIPGQGHINAFLKSAVVLPEVTAFLARQKS